MKSACSMAFKACTNVKCRQLNAPNADICTSCGTSLGIGIGIKLLAVALTAAPLIGLAIHLGLL